MKAAVIVGFAFSVLTSIGAHAAEPRNTNDAASLVVEQIAAAEMQRADVARQLAPLKSTEDVNRYIRNTPKELSPFAALDRAARVQFVQSLKFNNNGLTEFDYTTLRSLTPSQVYRILSLFGMESGSALIGATPETSTDEKINSTMLLPDFLVDYYCEYRATCARTTGKACTSNC